MKPIKLPAGTTHVRFGELAQQIADALHPSMGPDDERFFYHAARINLDDQLKAAVTRGALPVKDALTHGPHTFPHGDALNDALVTVDDLCRFAADRGIPVIVGQSQHKVDGTQKPIVYSWREHVRLEPRMPWRGGRITEIDRLTLQEAAEQASEHAGRVVTVRDFLRAGARGEIVLRAVVPQETRIRSVVLGEPPPNYGGPVPAGAYADLPIDACQQLLGNIGRARWRTFERSRDVDGLPHRFTAWELASDEPDFETTLDDCRVTGRDVHALADAFAPEGSSASNSPQAAPERTSDEPQAVPASARNPRRRRRDLLAPLIEAAQRECGASSDAAAVWPVLVKYAEEKRRPLIDASDEGIKWADGENDVQFFKLKNLRDRLSRTAERAR